MKTFHFYIVDTNKDTYSSRTNRTNEETRIKTKQDLVEQTAAIADLQEAKDNLIVEEVPIKDAKQNILKNVRRAKKQTK